MSAAVPTSTPSATITDGLWPYADLYYTYVQGRVTNTAQYGAGDWQLTSTTFDDAGRTVQTLDTRAIDQIRNAVAAGEEVDPDTYATLTSYNGDITNSASASGPDGSTIPAGTVILPAGSLTSL
jgi:hypothetical protein